MSSWYRRVEPQKLASMVKLLATPIFHTITLPVLRLDLRIENLQLGNENLSGA